MSFPFAAEHMTNYWRRFLVLDAQLALLGDDNGLNSENEFLKQQPLEEHNTPARGRNVPQRVITSSPAVF